MAREQVTPLQERVVSLKQELGEAKRTASELLRQILASGVGTSQTARGLLTEAERRQNQLKAALAEAEGKLATRTTEQLDIEVMVEALRSFDEAFAHLTLPEKREFLQLMLKEVVVHSDHIVVELYEGRRAMRMVDGLKGRRKRGSGSGPKSGPGPASGSGHVGGGGQPDPGQHRSESEIGAGGGTAPTGTAGADLGTSGTASNGTIAKAGDEPNSEREQVESTGTVNARTIAEPFKIQCENAPLAEVVELLGPGIGRLTTQPASPDKQELQSRRLPPPEVLADALQDRVYRENGVVRIVRASGVKR